MDLTTAFRNPTSSQPPSPANTNGNDRENEQRPPTPPRSFRHSPSSLSGASTLLDGQFSETLDVNMPYPSNVATTIENKRLRREIEELKNKIAERNGHLLGMQKQRNDLELRLMNQSSASSPLEVKNAAELMETQSKVTSLENEIETLRAKMEDMEHEENALQKKYDDAKMEVERLAETKQVLTESNEKLSEENKKLKETLTSDNHLEIQSAASEALTELNGHLRDQCETLAEETSSLKEALETSVADREALTQLKEKLESENWALKNQKRDAEYQVIQLKGRISDVNVKLKESEATVERLSTENAECVSQIISLNSEIDKWKTAIESLGGQNRDEQYSEAMKVIEQQRARIEVLEAAMHDKGYDLFV